MPPVPVTEPARIDREPPAPAVVDNAAPPVTEMEPPVPPDDVPAKIDILPPELAEEEPADTRRGAPAPPDTLAPTRMLIPPPVLQLEKGVKQKHGGLACAGNQQQQTSIR